MRRTRSIHDQRFRNPVCHPVQPRPILPGIAATLGFVFTAAWAVLTAVCRSSTFVISAAQWLPSGVVEPDEDEADEDELDDDLLDDAVSDVAVERVA